MSHTFTNQTVLVINTITVDKENQEKVLALQLEVVEKLKKGWPGFAQQRTLVSKDGTKVTTVEEWHTMDSLLAIVKDPVLLEYRAKIQAIGSSEPALYSIGGDSGYFDLDAR